MCHAFSGWEENRSALVLGTKGREGSLVVLSGDSIFDYYL